MKKFLIIALLIVLLLVGGLVAMVVVSFNPATFQNEVISSLQKLTGRTVSVNGETVVSWNPMPTVQLTDVRLGNMDKSQNPEMLTIEKMQISIEWSSLLKSPLVIKSVELTKPVLLLERLESNRANFTFPFLLDSNFQLQEVDLVSDGKSTSTKIDKIMLKDAVVRYNNRVTGVSFDVVDINGSVILDSIRGPFRFDGEGNLNGKIYTLSLKTGVFQGVSPIDVSIDLAESSAGAKLTLNGKLTPTKRDQWLSAVGNFSLDRLGLFAEGFSLFVPENIALKNASGSLSLVIAPNQDSVQDLIVQIGEGENATALTGTLTRYLNGTKPSYGVDVAMDKINLPEWEEYFNKLNWSWLTGETERPEISVKAMVKSIPYKKASFSDLVLDAKYQNNVLSVTKSSVLLPGETRMSFSGTGKTVQGTPLLDLNLNLQTQSGAELVRWLSPTDFKLLKTDVLQKGSMKAKLSIEPKQKTLSLNELKINDSKVTGVVQHTEEQGYVFKLNLSDVNLDTYTGWVVPEKTPDVSELPMLIKQSFEQATWMNDLTLKGSIMFKNGTVFGVPFSQMFVDGNLSKNILNIKGLKFKNTSTTDVSLVAVLNGVGRPQMNIDGLRLSLKTKRLPVFLEQIKANTTMPLIKNATDAEIGLALNGGRDGLWQFDTQVSISDANIKLFGSLDSSAEDTTIFKNLNFDIAHPNYKTFIGLVAPEFKMFPRLDGTFKAKGIYSGTFNNFKLTEARVGIGLQQLSGDLSFENQKVNTLIFDITSPSVDLERFLSDVNPIYTPTSGLSKKPYDFSVLDNWNIAGRLKSSQLLYGNLNIRQADIAFNIQNKEMALTKFSGNTVNADKAPFEITGKLDWNTTPKMALNFDIQKLPIRSDFMVLPDFAFGGGELSLKGDLTTRGVSAMEFAENLNGQGVLNVLGGQMLGANIEGMIPIITRAVQRNEGQKVFEPEFKRLLNGGKTVLNTISGDFSIANGVVRMMDLTMKTANATANPMQIIWDLPKRTLDVSIPVTLDPLNTLPPFILGISMTGNKAVYTPNYMDLTAALSSHSQEAIANNLRRKEEAVRAEIAQKRTDRINQSRELTIDARNAVASMEQKIQEYPFEKGKRILQSAKDALALVNQLAVREEPTDAQLIQQIEQARLVLVKAEEFQTALEQETLFNTQKQMDTYRNQSEQMVEQLKSWAEAYPDIVLLAKLYENADKNNEIVRRLYATLKPDSDKETVGSVLAETGEAVEKIKKAYQHASRFDLPLVAKTTIDGISDTPTEESTENKTVKGSFKRSN